MGPLEGVRVLELAGIGPGPFAGMMLADMGAEVIRIDRAGAVRGGDPAAPPADVLGRGRKSIGIDLKSDEGRELVLEMVASADVIFEGFRPGVAERLGVGPDECMARNPKIVYGRMTGWGQEGPYSHASGHDINYISLAGALEPMGRRGEGPVPPLNLIGDFGGGGMFLAFGIVCALLEAKQSGQGQVVDAAMVDGAATLMGFFHGFRAMGIWNDERGTNLLDSGAHFYDVYKTADDKYISLGSIEPQFYAELLEKLGLSEDPGFLDQNNRNTWPELKDRIGAIVAEKTRDEWDDVFAGSDVCYAPVLSMAEAPEHPHAKARDAFIDLAGVTQPAPAPRFSRTAPVAETPAAHAGQHTDDVLAAFGVDAERTAALRESGAIA